MARRKRKRETRTTDQADYDACLSWQRIFVGTMMAERDLLVPVGCFLQDTRAIVQAASECGGNEMAHERLREAWTFLAENELWFALSRALDARAAASNDSRPDRRAVLGRAFCDALRSIYPEAPPGFDRCGHSATGGD